MFFNQERKMKKTSAKVNRTGTNNITPTSIIDHMDRQNIANANSSQNVQVLFHERISVFVD